MDREAGGARLRHPLHPKATSGRGLILGCAPWTVRAAGCYSSSVRGLLEAVRADFGCLLVALLFIIIMASTIIFATVLTPPAHNAFV
jgi:hypothetical protein